MTNDYDITGKIGPLFPPLAGGPEWPMFAFKFPAYTVWNTIAGCMHDHGWSDDRIKEWLQSPYPRLAMESNLGEALKKATHDYAKAILED